MASVSNMSPAKLKIIKRACEIRLKNGEKLKDILDSYPALTPEERAWLEAELS